MLVQGAEHPVPRWCSGFSPVLWTVIVALAVRNSLMNAGGPIFDAFAMDRISHGGASHADRGDDDAVVARLDDRADLLRHAAGTLAVRDRFTVNFITIIVLYTIATSLLWTWFHDTEKKEQTEAAAYEEPLVDVPAEVPAIFEHA